MQHPNNPDMSSHGLVVDGNTKSSTTSKRIAASLFWCLTLNNYTTEEVDQLQKWLCLHCLDYIVQSEVGVQTGTPHLQGFIKLSKPGRPMETNPNKRIHWEKARNIKASMSYCAKAETHDGLIRLTPKRTIPDSDWELDLIKFFREGPNPSIIRWYWSPVPNPEWRIIDYLKQEFPHTLVLSKDFNPTNTNIDTNIIILNNPNNRPQTYQLLVSLSRGTTLIIFSSYEPNTSLFPKLPILVTNTAVEECVDDCVKMLAGVDLTTLHSK